MPSKLLRAKVAAAVIVALLSLGGVAAAATGLLPATTGLPAAVQRKAGDAPADPGGGSATGNDRSASRPAATVTTAGKDHAATGPDASGAARKGLCQAWQSGQGGEHGKREDSTAFKALAEAAGGTDKIAAYCQDVTSGGAGQGEQHRRTPSTGRPADPGGGQGQGGPPADPGGGQGQGGPPATTG
jgi:hypothetical protein